MVNTVKLIKESLNKKIYLYHYANKKRDSKYINEKHCKNKYNESFKKHSRQLLWKWFVHPNELKNSISKHTIAVSKRICKTVANELAIPQKLWREVFKQPTLQTAEGNHIKHYRHHIIILSNIFNESTKWQGNHRPIRTKTDRIKTKQKS